MFSYIAFKNSSSQPALYVFLDEGEVEELLLPEKTGKFHITDAGSHSVAVTDCFFRPLFNLYIPLYPNTFSTLIIGDGGAFLSDHLP